MLSSILASPPTSSFLDAYNLCHLSNVKSCASSSACMSSGPIFLSSSLVHFKNCSEHFIRSTALAFIPFMRFLLQSFEKFSRSSEIPFPYFFFYLRLFDCVRFQYSQLLVIFLFFRGPDFFLIWQFYSFSSFRYLFWQFSYYHYYNYFYII